MCHDCSALDSVSLIFTCSHRQLCFSHESTDAREVKGEEADHYGEMKENFVFFLQGQVSGLYWDIFIACNCSYAPKKRTIDMLN